MMNDEVSVSFPRPAPKNEKPMFIQMPEKGTISQKIIDLIESEVQTRVEEQTKTKPDAIKDLDQWIALAPGYGDWPLEIRNGFQSAMTSIYNSFNNISDHKRKDDEE